VSFILDALRKSETERQQEALPSLSRLPVGAPRVVVPGWVWVVMSALVIVTAGFGLALWQEQRSDPTVAGVTGSDEFELAGPRSDTDVSVVSEAETAQASVGGSVAESPTNEPIATSAAPESAAARVVDAPGFAAARPSAPPAGPERIDTTGTTQVQDPVRDNLPTLNDLEATGLAVPSLELEMLFYREDTAGRIVFINGQRYRQGDRLKEGPRVTEIRPDAVVLNDAGREFLLLPD
jgi:general secretion pathway protein B